METLPLVHGLFCVDEYYVSNEIWSTLKEGMWIHMLLCPFPQNSLSVNADDW